MFHEESKLKLYQPRLKWTMNEIPIFFKIVSHLFHQDVSENTSGFYLSELALKDLGLIPYSFPSQISKANMTTMDDGKALCACPQ